MKSAWVSSVLVATSLTAVVGVYVVSVADRNVVDFVLVAAIAMVAVAPLIIRILAGTFDLFEPYAPALLAFALLFVGRPISDISSDTRLFYNANVIDETYTLALALTLVAVTCFAGGYVGAKPGWARALPVVPPQTSRAGLRSTAAALTCLATAALVLKTQLAGGLVNTLSLRSQQGADYATIPLISESVMLALPALLLLLLDRRTIVRAMAIVPAAVLLIASLPTGDRRYLVTTITAVVVFVFLRAGRRPHLGAAALAVALTFFIAVSPLRTSRTGESDYWTNFIAGVSDPAGAMSQLLLAGDTEMVNNFAYELTQVGSDNPIAWQYGASAVAETVLQPIPRQLWTNKPEPIRSLVIEANWGMVDGHCVTICPTFSVLGSLYADFGWFSLIAGSIALGVLFRVSYEYFRRFERNELVQVAYSAFVFLAFYLWWSSLSVLALGVGLYVVPLAALAWLAGGHVNGIEPSRNQQIPLAAR